MKQLNYFDHAATTMLYPEVLEILSKSFSEDFANPNSQHALGSNLLKKIEEIRSLFLASIGAKKNDLFIFTSSATESNNTVIRGVQLREGDVILYSKADHPSLVAPVEKLAKDKKLILKPIVLSKDGGIDLEEFKKHLTGDVKLVLLTHINNQSGAINDINLLSLIVKDRSQAHVHVDAVQSFTKLNLNVGDGIDSMSVTSHKIGGPKGIAGLYLKKNHKVEALLVGGDQENGMRAGTQVYPLIAAFYEALRISLNKQADSFVRMEKIRNDFQERMRELIFNVSAPFENSSPYIFTFILPGIPSDVFLRHLETKGFYLSSTSACSSKIKGFNPTFKALNIPENFHKNVIRLSFSHDTSGDSVKLLIAAISEVWNDLKFLIKK